jgi:cytochrome c oxidase subunit 2
MTKLKTHSRYFIFSFLSLWSIPAWADRPRKWQLGFQEAATPVMERITDLHNFVLWIIFGVAILVISLLVYVMWRFRESKNKSPAKFTHNSILEIVWTSVPVLLLLLIAVPSFKLMFYMDRVEEPEMTVKVIGNMWFWSYEYPEHKISFDSNIILDNDLKPEQMRLFAVDNAVVVPVDTNVRVLFTSADVLHSWAVPSFGIKRDCVPGRLNEAWFRIKKEGIYFGQCSELCGMKHGFMPINVRAVSKEEFNAWVQSQKAQS